MSNFFTLQYPIYDSMAYNFQHKKSQLSFIRLPSFAAIPYIYEIMILPWCTNKVFSVVFWWKTNRGAIPEVKAPLGISTN
jgi:hypothetical protein